MIMRGWNLKFWEILCLKISCLKSVKIVKNKSVNNFLFRGWINGLILGGMSEARLIGVQNNEQRLKWDARGALFGHPGPSPPFGKFLVWFRNRWKNTWGLGGGGLLIIVPFLYKDYFTGGGVCLYDLMSCTGGLDIKVHQRVANRDGCRAVFWKFSGPGYGFWNFLSGFRAAIRVSF